jgi:hypothetical protein
VAYQAPGRAAEDAPSIATKTTLLERKQQMSDDVKVCPRWDGDWVSHEDYKKRVDGLQTEVDKLRIACRDKITRNIDELMPDEDDWNLLEMSLRGGRLEDEVDELTRKLENKTMLLDSAQSHLRQAIVQIRLLANGLEEFGTGGGAATIAIQGWVNQLCAAIEMAAKSPKTPTTTISEPVETERKELLVGDGCAAGDPVLDGPPKRFAERDDRWERQHTCKRPNRHTKQLDDGRQPVSRAQVFEAKRKELAVCIRQASDIIEDVLRTAHHHAGSAEVIEVTLRLHKHPHTS